MTARHLPPSGYLDATTHADAALFRERMAKRKRAAERAAPPDTAPAPPRLVIVYGRNQRTVIGGNEE